MGAGASSRASSGHSVGGRWGLLAGTPVLGAAPPRPGSVAGVSLVWAIPVVAAAGATVIVAVAGRPLADEATALVHAVRRLRELRRRWPPCAPRPTRAPPWPTPTAAARDD